MTYVIYVMINMFKVIQAPERSILTSRSIQTLPMYVLAKLKAKSLAANSSLNGF